VTGRRALGFLILAIGGLGSIVYGLGYLDPVGAKLADDGDPFGAPSAWWQGVVGLVICILAAGLGAGLAYRGRPRSSSGQRSERP